MAQAWGWCEWIRISLITAALFAAAITITATTLAHRSQQPRLHLQYARSLPDARVEPRAPAGNDIGPGALGAIHYWSDDQSTTVTVRLPQLVYFDSHRLSHPNRIYFDLQQTRMPENLHGSVLQVNVGQSFVSKIRVADRGPGVTRLVLETKPDCAYSAMIAPAPYRLIIRLHAPE
jgi:hypothetical protein